MRASVALLVVVVAAASLACIAQPASAQFQFNFDGFDFGGGGESFFGGAQEGGQKEAPKAASAADGEKDFGFASCYVCKDGQNCVSTPYECPCPGHRAVKCKIGDWYVCKPADTVC
eukprot:Opistho-2@94148